MSKPGITPARRAARIRNWQIFRLRGAYTIFSQHSHQGGMDAVNELLENLGAKKEPRKC